MTSQLYVLMKRGYYYRPEARGYTAEISEAWRVQKNEAEFHCHGTHGEVTMHPLKDAVTTAKSTRPTREELREMVKKLRDAAMDVPNLDSGHPWSETLEGLIIEADAMLTRGASGGYVKKTECDHARIRALAPVFWARMKAGDRVLTIAREHGVNRTTVRKWAKHHQKHRDELCACARVVLGPDCEGQTTSTK